MRKCFVLTVASAAIAGAASAQSPSLGLTIRAGAFFPTTSAATAAGERWYHAGAEFDLFKLKLPATPVGAAISISIDTYGRAGSSSVPLLANFSARADRFRYSVGAGASFVRRSGFEDSVQFAYQASIGYDVVKGPVPVMLEVRYFGVANSSNFFDGIAASVGVRL